MSTVSNQKEITLLNKILEESSKSLTSLNDLSSEQKLVYIIKLM
jgi:hypothetical protein